MVHAAPWAGKEQSYAGWVPNVGSHLSFSLIGAHRGPEVTSFTRRYGNRVARLACVLQLRETDDFLTPKWFNRWFMPDVRQHWVLIGSTRPVETPVSVPESWSVTAERTVPVDFDDQGMLVGRIHVAPYQKERPDRRRQEAMLRALRQRLMWRGELTDHQLDALPAEIQNEIRGGSRNAIALDFALVRTGELRIWYEPGMADHLLPEDRFDLAKQAYFFVKDMVHQHVHHDPSSDQMTPLTAAPESQPGALEDAWRRETVWSLSRVVDTLNRHGKLKDLREALGILAYADAFQKTLLLYKRDPEDETRFLPYNAVYRYDYAHIRDSIRVRIDQTAARRTQLAQMLVATFAGSIAMMALLSSLVSTYNGTVNDGRTAGRVLNIQLPEGVLPFLAGVPYVPLLLSIVALFGLSWLFLSEERMGPPQIRSRKVVQAIRGIVNSIAIRLQLSARPTHLFLQSTYILMILMLGVAAIWVLRKIVSQS
jgi:hypothetical protein